MKKLTVEYDGKQHFEPVTFGSKNNMKILKNFISTLINDEIKDKYCEDVGIKLIRIPYFEQKNIIQILTNNNIIS